jgi:hypothetical protein
MWHPLLCTFMLRGEATCEEAWLPLVVSWITNYTSFSSVPVVQGPVSLYCTISCSADLELWNSYWPKGAVHLLQILLCFPEFMGSAFNPAIFTHFVVLLVVIGSIRVSYFSTSSTITISFDTNIIILYIIHRPVFYFNTSFPRLNASVFR